MASGHSGKRSEKHRQNSGLGRPTPGRGNDNRRFGHNAALLNRRSTFSFCDIFKKEFRISFS